MQKSRIAGSTLMVLFGLGCPAALADHHGGQPKQAMFKTKAEAEAAEARQRAREEVEARRRGEARLAELSMTQP